MLTPERRGRGKQVPRYSTLNDFQKQKCYRLLSGTELKTKLSAHAMLEEQIKALSLHSHEGLLSKNVNREGAESEYEGVIWQTYYFRLEPTRLAYYTPSYSPRHINGGNTVGTGPEVGQFLLEEVLSVNSRSQLCEIEIRDSRDNMHLLRANSKEDLKLWTFAIMKAIACIGCQKKLAELSNDKTVNALMRKQPSVLKSKSHVGCFATEGRRSSMEDEWFIKEKAATRAYPTLAGIFDGHSGIAAAQFVRDMLPDIIMKKIGAEGEDPVEILKEAFIATERAFLDQALLSKDRSGTTALVVMASAKDVIVSNCGDSRAVLCRGRKAVDLSRDHKPYQPDERERIERHGGWVEEVEVLNIPRLYRLGLDLDTLDEAEENSVGWVTVHRVNGVLAMSRSIGDLLIKDLKNQTFNVEFTGDLILAEPEVTITKLDQEADRFIIAATDGLWDVMTSQEVVEYVHDKLELGKNLQSISAKLCTEAVERGSLDNICIIIIDLHHLFFPPPPKTTLPIRTTPNRNSKDYPGSPPVSSTPPPSTPPPFSNTPPLFASTPPSFPYFASGISPDGKSK